ncbi:MAG: low-specificity L-threonine aldolase [Candidatus Heimdallarchaeota archaeon]|nr:low-specificity L-threonine aldolase [Candidatus Heimdallarchaeota archaeon]
MSIIDLRSDTVTKPTDEMRQAARDAIVGDDVFGDDPTVNELEQYAAELMGKEAAIYVSSGTQGNLLSILAHTRPGDEVILERESHIYNYEAGGISAVAGALPLPVLSEKGYIKNLAEYIKPYNIHHGPQTLLCMENTHNKHGGYALSVDQIKEMASVARDHNLATHLDGARIFNAVAYHGVDVKDYTKEVDSIQFCLSKGLSAPVGSMVAGTAEFIKKVREKRKMLGGGMRQVGIIAAPGLIALRDMRGRLVEDHANANTLAVGLRSMGIDVWENHTNIIICDVSSLGINSTTAIKRLEERNILAVPFSDTLVRLTTHRHISQDDIEAALKIISEVWLSN